MLDRLDDYSNLIQELNEFISNGIDKLKNILGEVASRGLPKL